MDSADRVNEKCAVVGVFNVKNSALACYYCLFAMQHRGQESSGISTTNGHKITTLKGEGLVTAVFSEGLDKLKGNASIGHNRYSTAGEDSKCDTQPIFAKYALGEIALAHNGNLVNAKEVRDELIAQGAIFQSHLDTENLIHLIARSKKARLRDRIIEGLQQIKGAYSFVILSRGKLFAVRDPWGFRPLSLGEIINDDGSKGFVVASESCAFDLVGARFVRDIKPGEMLIFSAESTLGNSSLTQSSRELEKSTLDGLKSYHRADFPAQPTNLAQDTRIAENIVDSAISQNLGENQAKNAESTLDSTESQNLGEKSLSLRDSAKQNRGNPQDLRAKRSNHPPIEKAQNLQQGGLPRRFCESARNDENMKIAESSLDSAPSKQEANSSIVDEFSELCEASDDDRTDGSSRKRALRNSEKSPQDAEFATNARIESIQVFPPTPKHCIFEFVYFARPDSVVFNKSVYEIRKNMGIQLAREYKIKADFVIPVPDSGVISALGYAQESGIPFEFGIVRNHYIGRTFIEPTQKSRELKVKLKLNPIARLLQGREIVVIDDSVVRGTTSKQIISILRKAGAKKVHLVVASPQTIAPCYYGVDTPDSADLICANKSLEEVCEFIGADSLHFLSLEGLYKSIGIENGKDYCKACFDGEYII